MQEIIKIIAQANNIRKQKCLVKIQGKGFKGKQLGRYRLQEAIKVKSELLRTKVKIRSKDKIKVEKQKYC